MELRNIRSFIKVAEFENFSKAAEVLGYAQSTITTQIQQLEEELGVNLFDRIGKKVVLSDKGRSFLLYANQMMKLESESIETISSNCVPRGILRIGTIESIASSFFAPLLETYIKTYPTVSIEVTEGTTLELFSQLEKGLLDLVLLLDRPVFRPALQTVYSKSATVPFFSAADHPLADQKNVSPKKLEQETLFLTEKNNNYRQVFDEIAAKNNLSIQHIQEIANASCILYLVEQNLGVSLLPDYRLLPSLKEKKIALFTVEGFDIRMDLQVLYHRQKFVSLAMRRFTETVEEFFAAL